jgi:hypothetical protein
MSLVVCARPGCDLAAATSLLVDGRHVAAVCSERCGYELIGPKRSADDMSDAAAGGDDKRQDVVYRELDKKRYADLAEMAVFIQDICNRHKDSPDKPNTNHIATLAKMRWILHQIIDQKKYKVHSLDYWRNRADIQYDAVPSITRDESKRLGDMNVTAGMLRQLAGLASKIDVMHPMTVTGTMLQIGRRLNRSGSDLKQRIDVVIAAAVATIDRIAENKPYVMNSIGELLFKLRDDIAADYVLDTFDDSDAGRAAKYAGIPDDVRFLVALRADPIETLALFITNRVTSMCATEYGFLQLRDDGSEYWAQISGKTDEQKHRHAIETRFNDNSKSFGPNVVRYYDGFFFYIIGRKGTPRRMNFRARHLATGLYYAEIFLDCEEYDNTFMPESLVCKIWKAHDDLSGDDFVAEFTVRSGDIQFRGKNMAIDAKGYLWFACTMGADAAVAVFDKKGTMITKKRLENTVINCICAAVDGIWMATTKEGVNYITLLRLAPDYNYSAGM